MYGTCVSLCTLSVVYRHDYCINRFQFTKVDAGHFRRWASACMDVVDPEKNTFKDLEEANLT